MTDWRDSYDAWKLATPPEYEMTGEEEQELERREAEDRVDELMQEEQTPEIMAEIAAELEFLTTEPCPNCNVEWADQYHGDCDVCHGKRRVQRLDDLAHLVDRMDTFRAMMTCDIDDTVPF